MGLVHRSGVCALAVVAGAAALQVEPVVLRDLAFGDSGRSVSIGAVRTPLWSAAFAQTADTFTLDNVEVRFGTATYQAGTVAFEGVSTPRSDVEALLSSASSVPLADRLARIDARQITIPDLKVEQRFGSRTETATYKNIVLTGVVHGRVGQATASATGAEVQDGQNRTLFSYGRLSVSDFDAPALARIYDTKADAADAPLTRIYGAFSVDDVDMVNGTDDTDIRIAHLTGRDFMARPTRESWAGTFALLSDLGPKDKLSDEEGAHAAATMADFLGAFDFGLVEATGIDVKLHPKNRPSDVTSHIGRLAYTGTGSGQPADVRLEGLQVTDPDGRVAIDTVSFTGFSFRPTLEGLKALDGKSFKDLDPAAIRALAPKIGTFRVAGVDVDTVKRGVGKPAGKPEQIKANLKEFEIAADSPVNALPSDIRIGLKDFAMALPDRSTDEGIQTLTALGYKALDLSLLVSAKWNEGSRELAVPEISVQGRNMGRVSLNALFGDVSQEIFSPDTAVASVALIGSRAKSVDLTLENAGLLERYLEMTAKEQKTTPEALRRSYATAAAVVIPSMIGNSEQARTLSQAVARFIAKPGRLTVRARAKDPAGLGVADIVTLPEPAAVLGKLDVTATVE